MSKANPTKAVAALLPAPVSAGGYTVHPVTLAMWAALERIDSPLLVPHDSRKAPDALSLIPSLYLITHGAQEFFRRDFMASAMAWADTVPASAIHDIRRAAETQWRTVADVTPEADKDKPAKKATGRSPSSAVGRPATRDGRGMKSSGRSRSPRSASSAARSC